MSEKSKKAKQLIKEQRNLIWTIQNMSKQSREILCNSCVLRGCWKPQNKVSCSNYKKQEDKDKNENI